MVTVLVDRNGMARNPKVVRPLGMGLDEKQWRQFDDTDSLRR